MKDADVLPEGNVKIQDIPIEKITDEFIQKELQLQAMFNIFGLQTEEEINSPAYEMISRHFY